MTGVLRACIVCGTPTRSGSRCSRHALRRERGTTTERGLGWQYQKVRRRVLAEETSCWMCGGAPTYGDPLEVDHLVPRSQGGTNDRWNLRAAHRSCNLRRGVGGYSPVVNAHPHLIPMPPRRPKVSHSGF